MLQNVLFVIFMAASAAAQQAAAPAAKPLPDIATLLRDVESHQKELESVKHNYIFKEDSREEELVGANKVKKTVWEERESASCYPIRKEQRSAVRNMTATGGNSMSGTRAAAT